MLLSYTINQDTLNNYAIDMSSIEEIAVMYNYIVGTYRNIGGNQQSRQSMKSLF